MQAVTFFFAFVAVLALIGVAAWLVRRFATNRLGANTNRGRMPRLAVIDAAAVDGRRRLVLVRRDNIEHLIMIGGPTDIVVESTIVRAQPGRDQLPQRAIGAEPPPLRIAPLPDAARVDNARADAARADSARADGDGTKLDGIDHHELQMPEPPPRPVRPPFADEVRRTAPAERREPSRSEPLRNDFLRNDPLAGFAAEPIARPEPRSEVRSDPVPPRLTRTEPVMPRPQRSSEPLKAPPPIRAPERAAPPPPPPPPIPVNADQNLAEMAQRLEAALRRPAGEPMSPPVAPEPPPLRPARSEAPPPAKNLEKGGFEKSGFENLEDEMASLLGRPKPSS
jgi:flagellar protein FliO/FliZ